MSQSEAPFTILMLIPWMTRQGARCVKINTDAQGGAFWKIVEQRRAGTGQSAIAAAERTGAPQGAVRSALQTRTAACAWRSDMPRHRAGWPVSAGVADAGRRHRRCRLRPHPPLSSGSRREPQRRRATRMGWPSRRSGATGCAVAGCGRDNPSGARGMRQCDGTGLLWRRCGLDGAGFSGAQTQPRGGRLDRGRLGHRAAGATGRRLAVVQRQPGRLARRLGGATMTRAMFARAAGSAFKDLGGMAGRRLWSGWPGRCRGRGDQESPSFGTAGRRLVAGRSAVAVYSASFNGRQTEWLFDTTERCKPLDSILDHLDRVEGDILVARSRRQGGYPGRRQASQPGQFSLGSGGGGSAGGTNAIAGCRTAAFGTGSLGRAERDAGSDGRQCRGGRAGASARPPAGQRPTRRSRWSIWIAGRCRCLVGGRRAALRALAGTHRRPWLERPTAASRCAAMRVASSRPGWRLLA